MWHRLRNFFLKAYYWLFKRSSNVSAFTTNPKSRSADAELTRSEKAILKGQMAANVFMYTLTNVSKPSNTLRMAIALSHGVAGEGGMTGWLAHLLIRLGVDVNSPWHDCHDASYIVDRIYIPRRQSHFFLEHFDGYTPLAIAASLGNLSLVKALVKAGAKARKLGENRTDLYNAIMLDRGEIVAELILAGAEFQAPFKRPEHEGNRTPLHEAAVAGRLHAAQALIDAGANVNATDSQGHTPLHDVCWFSQYKSYRPKIVKALLDAGANVNALDNAGISPLQSAANAESNTATIMRMLIDAGANKDHLDQAGNTPLHLVFHERGADNLWPAFGRKFRKALQLIQCGMDPFIINNKGETAFLYFLQQFNSQELKLLGKALLQAKGMNMADDASILGAFIACGANIQHVTNENMNVLHFAAQNYKDAAIIQELLRSGLDTSAYLNMQGNERRTPLDSSEYATAYITWALCKAGAKVTDQFLAEVVRTSNIPITINPYEIIRAKSKHQKLKAALFTNPNLAHEFTWGPRSFSVESRLLSQESYPYLPQQIDDLKATLFMWVEFIFSTGRRPGYAKEKSHISDLPKDGVVPNVLTFLWGPIKEEHGPVSPFRADIIDRVQNDQTLQSFRKFYEDPNSTLGKPRLRLI